MLGWDSAGATSPSLLRKGALLPWARQGLAGGEEFLEKRCPVEEITLEANRFYSCPICGSLA